MSTYKHRLTLNVLLAGLLLSAASAHAIPTLNTYAVAYAPGHVLDNGTVSGKTITASASSSSAVTSAQAQTYGTYGVIKAGIKGQSHASDGIHGTVASAGASVGYRDAITLSNAALNGQNGQITFAYYIESNSTADITGNAGGYSNGALSFTAWANNSYAQLTHYVADGALGNDRSEYNFVRNDAFGYVNQSSGKLNYLYLTVDFVWGQGIVTGLNVDMNASTHSLPGQVASFDLDALHSGYWGGVVSAKAGGIDVRDYAISSASGTDYSASFAPRGEVPEPASLALVALGVAGLALRRRKDANPVR